MDPPFGRKNTLNHEEGVSGEPGGLSAGRVASIARPGQPGCVEQVELAR